MPQPSRDGATKMMPTPSEVLIRSSQAKIRSMDESSRQIELSFSSETPCRTWFGDEILQHTKASVSLERLLSVGSLLYNHDPSDARNVVGRVISAEVDEQDKVCRAVVAFDEDETAELVYSKVKSGTIRGVSVGYTVSVYENVDDGHVTDDGFKGPCVVARRWEPLEISFTPVPADPSVGPGRSIIFEGGDVRMSEREKRAAEAEDECEERVDELEQETEQEEPAADGGEVKEAEPDDASDEGEDDEERERAVKTERKRAAEIADVCRAYGMDPSGFIKRGASLSEVNSEILKRQRKEMTALPVSHSRSAIEINRDEREKFRSAATDGLAMRAGVRVNNPAPGAEEFRGISLIDLSRVVLERAGEAISYQDSKMEIAARAFSSSDFPIILSNLANKTLLAQYEAYPSTWQAWCTKGSLSDFKEAHKMRISESPDLEEVLEGGEYKMAEFSESGDGYRLKSYGKRFALTRQMIINDDLNAFNRIPMEMGNGAARTVNSLVYKTIVDNVKLADGEPIFHSKHKNLGTGGALSTATLTEARVALRRQKGLGGSAYLNLTPAFLLVPAELETVARQILSSSTDIGQENPAVVNPFANSMQLVVEPMLEDPDAWYVVAAPSQIETVEVAFLGGNANPTIEQHEGWKVDGIEYKVRLDFGVKAWDHRGIFKNAGK